MHNEDGSAAEDRRPTRGNIVPRLHISNESLTLTSSQQDSAGLSS